MKIYVRKIKNHDITHEVSITNDIVNEFFDGKSKFNMIGKISKTSGEVTINSATDARFGGDFKNILRAEGDVEENDIIIVYKDVSNYVLEIVNQKDSRYDSIKDVTQKDIRHSVLYTSEEESIIDTEELEEKDVEKLFKEYLNSLDIVESTINAYISHIKLMSKEAIEEGIIEKSLFDITDIEELNIVAKKIQETEGFKNRKNKSNHINSAALNQYIIFIKNLTEDDMKHEEYSEIIISDKTDRVAGGENIIYYGVPGTGKSFLIDEKIEEISKNDILRVTFHPEYSYNDFTGQLLPTVIKEGEDKGKYKYDFKEGPFTTALKRAYMYPNKNIYLILEEMSRGNCAAIFGDIFQLLDRNADGSSRYFVDNEVIANEILNSANKEMIILEIEELDSGKIKIPSNLHIWGTVNTSDQNVFVMDTAFKRRFEWIYVDTKPIPKKDADGNDIKNEKGELIYLNDVDIPIVYDTEKEKISWIKFYQLLNTFISSSKYLGLGEDKQLGQFFIDFASTDEAYIKEKVNNKLLHYLWFDVQEKSYKEDKKLFNDDITCFSDLYSYSKDNKKIFSNSFIEFIKGRG